MSYSKRQQKGSDLIDFSFDTDWAEYLACMRNNTNVQQFFDETSQTIYNFIITVTNVAGGMAPDNDCGRCADHAGMAFRGRLIESLMHWQNYQVEQMYDDSIDDIKPVKKKVTKNVSKK